jgi:hypothetical protein
MKKAEQRRLGCTRRITQKGSARVKGHVFLEMKCHPKKEKWRL